MKRIRIGNGCGFWGDSVDAPLALAEAGNLDYLTLEYLAELTMSILAVQKAGDPQKGFASDFLLVLDRLAPILREQSKLRLVTNAGGMNPSACATQARAILDKHGLTDRRIAIVVGDDLLPILDELLSAGEPLAHLDSGEPLWAVRPRVVSANAYLGARPIAEALTAGASIVITGRVADASLTVGPALAEFGWPWDDWDRLAAATTAGHLIECGAQATGGLWMNWYETDLTNVGYPLVELAEDGSFELTKPARTGGIVNRQTTTEQLLYEVGDPAAYLTPDVVADFTTLQVTEVGTDRVAITHARGRQATDSFKVSIAYRDGFTSAGTLVIAGPNAVRKARAAGEMLLGRLARAGVTFERSHIEAIGAGACVPGLSDESIDPPEVVLRVAVADASRSKVERFTKEFAPLVTSGPPGVTGYTTGRPPVREVFAYRPALVRKAAVARRIGWSFFDSA